MYIHIFIYIYRARKRTLFEDVDFPEFNITSIFSLAMSSSFGGETTNHVLKNPEHPLNITPSPKRTSWCCHDS